MLGETGLPNGYFRYRTCRVNISSAVAAAVTRDGGSPKLQLDLILAPQNGMTGCWTELCGKMTFAWLLNAFVLQRPTAAVMGMLGPRARASLADADGYSASAVREWSWVGPFDDDHGNGMADKHAIETAVMRTGLPPNLNATYPGKNGAAVQWRSWKDGEEAAAPHLPLSMLLPTRQLNTASVAFAMTRVHCTVASGASIASIASNVCLFWILEFSSLRIC